MENAHGKGHGRRQECAQRQPAALPTDAKSLLVFFFNNNIKSHSGPSYHSFLPPFEGRRNTQLQLSHTKISGKFILMQQDRQAEAFTLNSFVAGNLPSVPPPALLHTTFPFLFYEWSRFCITLLQQVLWQHLRSISASPASLPPC